MVDWINSWAQGIIVATIISTIIEMILPNGNIQKYIKTVIGIYIVFVIISPIFSLFTKKTINIKNVFSMATVETANIQTNIISVDKYVEQDYTETIKNDIIQKLNEKGYLTNPVEVQIDTQNENTYGEIVSINLIVEKKTEETNSVSKVKKIDVSITNTTPTEDTISDEEKDNLKEYLETIYGIKKDNITVESHI